MNLQLKPFYFAVLLYVFANFVFLVLALLNNNTINIEFFSFYIKTSVLIKAFVFQIIGLFFIVAIYHIFNKRNFNEKQFFKNFSGCFLLFWQFLFLLFAIFLGLGVVDSESNVNPNLVRLSNFISADILYFLIAPSLKSNKLYFINTVLYLVSSIVRGWLGGIVISFFIYLCRVGSLKVSLKTLIFTLCFFILMLSLSPFLIDLKFAIRTGETVNFDTNSYSEKLDLAMEYVLGRFQHLGHTALLINHAENYRQLYESQKILPYWLEGIPQYFVYKLMGNSELFTYAQIMAIMEFGANASQPWNTNTGISGWMVVLQEKSILFFLYWGGVITLFFAFLLKYANRQIFNVVSVLMVIYLYHGWLGSFFNLIVLTLIVVFLKKVRFK